jgi:hypothetical protein
MKFGLNIGYYTQWFTEWEIGHLQVEWSYYGGNNFSFYLSPSIMAFTMFFPTCAMITTIWY